MPSTLDSIVEQITTKIETILKIVNDFLSLMSLKTMTREIVNRIECRKSNVETACCSGLYRGKYRKN